MATPRPYRIDVPSSKIERLKQKLALADFPEEVAEAGWDYGTPLADVKWLAAYWQNGFDWKAQEAKLNKLPNFETSIDVQGFGTLDVHFVHQQGSSPNSIPLLFVHGWPGSYMEVTKILPLLTRPSDPDSPQPSFHVVAPSLPNYGWSSGVTRRGFGLAQYAETCHKLMLQLGYDKYVTQGGDWGFFVTRVISMLYPSHCLATHVNMIRCKPPTFAQNPLLAASHAITPYTEAEQQGLKRTAWFDNEGQGYRLIQATKPQTVSYGVTDSPVGLLAYIVEKLHDWTDSYPWTDDELLTWVSIYYFSRAGPSAPFRMYYEAAHAQPSYLPQGNKLVEGGFVIRERMLEYVGGGVKLGLSYFPKELGLYPKVWARTMGEVVFVGDHKIGGHLAAHEVPELLVGDLRKMFGKGGPCYDIVKGKAGY